jgi:hypothetical protein
MNIKRAWLAIGIGVLGSQAGHLIAYQFRFGSAALPLQSSGSHAYFPGVVRASLGAAAALVLAGMFLIGLARILSGRSIRRSSAPNYLRLVALLYTTQLACFVVQEASEALVAGGAVPSGAHLLLWGTLGQLPVAMIGAAGLRWLLARFEGAVAEIRTGLAAVPRQLAPAATAVPFWRHPNQHLVLKSAVGASLAKRGPPSSLRVSST